MAITTWRALITDEMNRHGEDWDDVIDHAFAEGDMDTEFDDGYGGADGSPFTLWTHHRVYFPVVYDGAEWVGSVNRYPDAEPTKHVGGQ